MADLPIGEWRQPSPAPSDHGSSSSDKSTSYVEEELTPPIEKKRRTEEDKDSTARDEADHEDRVSK